MKKYLLLSIFFLPLQSFAFSFFGSPVKVPEQKEYVIYSKQIESKPLPDTENAIISTTLLVYNIQTQASISTQMFYLKGNQLYTFKNSSWAMPVSKMLTVAAFEYILDHNIVNNLAFQDINIRQDFTLSGTTTYGPILDLDNKQFYFYITFYLKNEKTGFTKITTIKYHQNVADDKLNANTYAEMTNTALTNIFSQLKPWLIENLKIQKHRNKEIQAKNANTHNFLKPLLAKQ
ncbi:MULTISPECIES: hypothetical protein [Francisella]|uniref:ABC-type transport auxiliary lipoprotein component domain-containing protein n=1 Tax=Francisella opportunistica TaxID=2016517 RepID=A0A345JQI4_9GAMM|nr:MULTISPECIES: hypothetical protein [Francisella]APC91285.1 hypothetical protein BBG19_0549 [Francisella sp. MA067296]AXH29580.1 hypothetical protein CGC43_02800 [Francisella opportunistica]AXH31231.1 hypothetical protein CGC44_02775 [Francisella opportunistica]AXH32878.1 hypothetical protein CGC45_02785 [Francisella opportunistica]